MSTRLDDCLFTSIRLSLLSITIRTTIKLDRMQFIVLFHILLLSRLLLKNNISIDKFCIVYFSLENSVFLYPPNHMSHLSNSAGVCTLPPRAPRTQRAPQTPTPIGQVMWHRQKNLQIIMPLTVLTIYDRVPYFH